MRINFCLSDMYLREGDIRHAETAISAMRGNIASMSNKLEDLKWLYFYNDRRTLYQIRCMDYEAALNICHANPDYDFLKMVYIAIEMERIAAYDKDKAPDWIWNSLRNEVRDLYRITTLPPGISVNFPRGLH